MFFKILKKILTILVIAIMIFSGVFLVLRLYVFPRKHFDIIKEEASKNNIDPYLVLAVIKTESGFNSLATSKKHAKGLMQIMDTTAEDINNNANVVEDLENANLYDEDVNIALGCSYLKSLIDKYDGNYYIAICAYNAGMGNVNKWLNDGLIEKTLDSADISLPFEETSNYLKKVITNIPKIYIKDYTNCIKYVKIIL